MKKIICIACVLALIFSLTACSNNKTDTQEQTGTISTNSPTDETTSTVKDEKIDKYINKNTLDKKDNISFLLNSINDNEYHIVNIKSSNEINSALCNENTPDCQEHKDALRILAYGTDSIKFIYKGYKFFVYTGETEPFQTWKPSDNNGTIISQNGYLLAVEEAENDYCFWAKAKNQYIQIEVEAAYEYTHAGQIKKNFKKIQTADQASQVFDLMKEIFTFATIKSETKTNKSILWEVPDLSTTTIFGEEATTTVANDWVFENDLLYKGLADKGINLTSSCHLYANQNGPDFISATYNFELTAADREAGLDWSEYFSIDITPLKDGDSYDMGKTVKELEIGKTKFKLIGITDRLGVPTYKIKTESGYECLLEIDKYNGASEYDLEDAHKYLEKIFLDD